jgi:predicted  nucleic acid-binding Zn-ribbon protein
MGIGREVAAALLVACLSGGQAEAASPQRRDNESDLRARLAREKNPVNRGKYEIRLARVKLFQAIEAFNQQDFEGTLKLLEDYLEQAKKSWATLKDSGRPAHKKPQGFKELDIELREDARYLEDLRRRIPYTDREPVERIEHEVEQLRGEVLRALFPPGPPRKP